MLGGRRCFIVGCYLVPYYASTIEDVVATISQRPWGAALPVVRNFNTNLSAPEGRAQDVEITAAMEESVLEDISRHFIPRHKLWLKDGRTWAMHRGG